MLVLALAKVLEEVYIYTSCLVAVPCGGRWFLCALDCVHVCYFACSLVLLYVVVGSVVAFCCAEFVVTLAVVVDAFGFVVAVFVCSNPFMGRFCLCVKRMISFDGFILYCKRWGSLK